MTAARKDIRSINGQPGPWLSRFRPLASALLALFCVLGDCNAQVVQTVTSFSGQGEAAHPMEGVLALGRDGRLFGTTFGASGSNGGIFRLSTGRMLTFPHLFDSTTGSGPTGGVTLATDGNYYGTTTYGGSANCGVLYRLTPAGQYTLLHEFLGASDGANPVVAPIQATDGNLYGVTTGYPTTSATLYKYTASGSFTTIYTFDTTHDGRYALYLVQAANGNLYGTATQGGTAGCGTIFEFSTAGTVLFTYSFPQIGLKNPQGCGPTMILQATDSNFYGTTLNGGNGLGTVFKLDSQGNVTTLYNFPLQAQFGGGPFGIVEATDGNFYGAGGGGGGTFGDGTLFRVTPAGAYTLLANLSGNNGNSPLSPPIQHVNGLIYGTTELGGTFGAGNVYSLNVGLAPFITFVQPAGKVGLKAQILGQGLTGATSVAFNGVKATSFAVVSNTYMTATVPAGATSGPVVVTTPTGTFTSNRSFLISK